VVVACSSRGVSVAGGLPSMWHWPEALGNLSALVAGFSRDVLGERLA
jgi:hypothetical protein